MEDEFLDLLAVDPEEGRRRALAVVGDSTDPLLLALAHRALAVDRRESGDVDGALSHLRTALDHAKQSGDREVWADILATRGGTRVILGDPRGGIRDLTAAADRAQGRALAPIMHRRGVARFILGEPELARDDALTAIRILRKEDKESVWLRLALQLLAECEVRLGRIDEAASHLSECRSLMNEDAGYELMRLRGFEAWIAFLKGDLPSALSVFSPEEISMIDEGNFRTRMAIVLATMNLVAGLVGAAIEVLESNDLASVPPTLAAESRSVQSRALFLTGEAESALKLALQAARDLDHMGMRLESAEAALTAIEASGLASANVGLADEAEQVATNLVRAGSRRSVDGWLAAARVANASGQVARAIRALNTAASFRDSTDLLVAASGWLARGYELEGLHSSAVLRACAAGLNALDEYGEIMGSSEIRAALTGRGRELAQLALRHAAHNPRSLLTWSERWRATSLAQPPVTPQGELSPAMAMLRDSARLIAEARDAGEPTDALERERRRLERKVRSEHHQQRAQRGTGSRRFDAAELVAEVHDGAFIELVDVDGTLHVLVVTKGRVRRAIAGETKDALELAEAGRFALRRAARTNRFAPGDLGQRLQDTILGNAVRMLPDGPITISPIAALHGVPFALMPALADRPFSIVPSAAQWLRARKINKPAANRLALVSGPNLLTGGAEVARLAERYRHATVLTNQAATVEATMNAIDGATLAHLATHGTFRADSPLFSALEMADGPLSVYELERLKRAPYRTILSACDSGVLAPVGAQEVLGLASALFSLGSAGLVCSIAEVNDEVTADLMMDVHAELDAGGTPAEALAKVRSEADPIKLATAAAFVALGV